MYLQIKSSRGHANYAIYEEWASPDVVDYCIILVYKITTSKYLKDVRLSVHKPQESRGITGTYDPKMMQW